jgi:Ca-activated chloride channel homolog
MTGIVGGAEMMIRRRPLMSCTALLLAFQFAPFFPPALLAQRPAPPPPPPENGPPPVLQSDSIFRVDVNLVQLNVAVTDKKGHYVTGLHPSDFEIVEDNIPEKIATFEEGARQPLALTPSGFDPPKFQPSAKLAPAPVGANVFILFDTSNYMYRGFVFAQDAISDFIRSLDPRAKVALYSYSRDVSRNTLLTSNREKILRGVRSTVAGSDAALYNALLLVLNDARRYVGLRVIVVFSNGPDNASMAPPEAVGELAQSEGIPIYMISTREARQDPISAAIFQRMSASTGGQAYFAKNWQIQQKAFASVRDDLAHLYSLSYYPQPNPNRGWRAITVKLVGKKWKGYHIRTRDGYRPRPPDFPDDAGDPALAP